MIFNISFKKNSNPDIYNDELHVRTELLIGYTFKNRVKSKETARRDARVQKIYSDALKITRELVLMRSARINLSKDFVVQQLHWWPNRKSDNKFYSSTTA